MIALSCRTSFASTESSNRTGTKVSFGTTTKIGRCPTHASTIIPDVRVWHFYLLNKERIVPMKLLAELSRASMPVQMKDHRDLSKLRILRAMGYIQVTIPMPRFALDGHWYREPSTVRQLTPLGQAVLRHLRPTCPNQASTSDVVTIGEVVQVDPLSFKVPPRLRRPA